MCFTSWHKAYEDTLPPAEIEPFDKRLAAAIEADKNYRLSSAGRRKRNSESSDYADIS
jgi:hypothetical protein